MIERIISDDLYETLRQKLIISGYLPDITTIPNIMSNDVNEVEIAMEEYNAAIADIVDNNGFCIELFGYTSNNTKGERKTPRIVIDLHQFLPSQIGNDTSASYEKIRGPEGEHYHRVRKSSLLSDLTFAVYIVGNNSEQMMVMNKLVMETLPHRGYIKRPEDENLSHHNNYFVRLKDKGHTQGLPEGILERYFIYEMPEIDEMDKIYIPGNITPINEIDLEVKLDNE